MFFISKRRLQRRIEETAQELLRDEARGIVSLMLDIRRDKLSSLSSAYLRDLDINPTDYAGLKKKPTVKYYRLRKDGKGITQAKGKI